MENKYQEYLMNFNDHTKVQKNHATVQKKENFVQKKENLKKNNKDKTKQTVEKDVYFFSFYINLLNHIIVYNSMIT